MNNSMQIILDVFYVLELQSNLISIDQLQEKGLTITIQKDCCQILHLEKGVIAQSRMTGNRMFTLHTQSTYDDQNCLTSAIQDDTWLWHYRYGHLNFNGLRALEQKQMVKRLSQI